MAIGRGEPSCSNLSLTHSSIADPQVLQRAWLIFWMQHYLSATRYLEPVLDLKDDNLGVK